MKNAARLLCLSLGCIVVHAGWSQNYTSYFTGNVTDVVTEPSGGVCLMGGATEDDNAMIWFLEQAQGGDVLILRASGSDGYNDYFYTDLGVTVNSVETIVFNDATASTEAYIHQRIEQAEAIWFAGGDQWNYISYWRDSPVADLINDAIANRNIVIGGTSAGMAVLGSVYFTAENGTITSAAALNNPYAVNCTIDSARFFKVPYMQNVITDTHYDAPDRRGRHTVFLAKIWKDYEAMPYGIACEEYVAVCVDTLGIARVYGGYPTYDEQAYFLKVNCENDSLASTPETCEASTPLTWSANERALTVYKVNGTSTGANYLDLNNWEEGSGGNWEYWWVENGVLNTSAAATPTCNLDIAKNENLAQPAVLFPNPAQSNVTLTSQNEQPIQYIEIWDMTGKRIVESEVQSTIFEVDLTGIETGLYRLSYFVDGVYYSVSLVVF